MSDAPEDLLVLGAPGGAAASAVDWESFYLEHADRVRRAVIRLGGPACDVEDLVQEVFEIAIKRAGTFEGRSQLSTWLYGIAIKVVAGARRRAKVRSFFGLDAASPPTPERLFESRQNSEILYQLLDQMAEKKRTVFILYELEELSGEEIARVLEVPINTVWTRLHHARKELADRYKKKLRGAP